MTIKRDNGPSLFSIDVEAHLQKLAANTYRSPHHYPVELVRLAIKRGAQKVQITIKGNRMEIVDDGRGIEKTELDCLNTIFTTGKEAGERERAIESMKTTNQIGLLAMFSPAPQVVEVETVNESGPLGLRMSKGGASGYSVPNLQKGSRIILQRNKKQWQEEVLLLKEYLRSVPQDIWVNNTRLIKKQFLTLPMVSKKLQPAKGHPHGWIGIPHAGDICRIWLLDHLIPWHHNMIAPWRGFVFEAAIEYHGPLTRSILDGLAQQAEELYRWLAKRYPSYPPVIKKRIEDLFFRQNRQSPAIGPINSLYAFRMADTQHWLNVSELKKRAVRDNLFAIPDDENPSKYNLAGKTVLSLSKSQIDFLVNHHQIPIQFLSPLLPPRFSLIDRTWNVMRRIRRIVSTLLSSKKRWLDENALSPEEKSLILWLNKRFYRHRTTLPGGKKQVHIIPRLADARGISSTAYIRETYALQPTYILELRRKHPQVQRALGILKQYPQNIDIIGSLFIH